MKRQTIALFLAILMVASAFTAVELTAGTTTASALTATQLTLTVSKTTPQIGETVKFTATLKRASGTSYVPLSGKWVRIGYYDANNVWHQDCSRQTDANGKITYERSWTSAGAKTRYAWFPGDTTYAAKKSAAVTVTVKWGTTLTMTTSPSYVAVGQQYTLSGDLKDQNGKPLAGRTIQLFFNKGSGWYQLFPTGGLKTDAYGHYSFSTRETSAMNIIWETKFAEESQYWGAASPNRQVAVRVPTTITAKWAGSLTVQGYLKDSQGNPLGNKRVVMYFKKYGENGWSSGVYGYTDWTGYYRIPLPYPGAGTWYYVATFSGDSTYSSSSSQTLAYAT